MSIAMIIDASDADVNGSCGHESYFKTRPKKLVTRPMKNKDNRNQNGNKQKQTSSLVLGS